MKKYYKIEYSNPKVYAFEESQPTGFVIVDSFDELKNLHKSRYNQMEIDGEDFYNDFRTELYISILSGENTTQDVFILEEHLHDLNEKLVSGDWLTAQNISYNIPLSGIYNQEMKDKIQLEIDNYVSENY